MRQAGRRGARARDQQRGGYECCRMYCRGYVGPFERTKLNKPLTSQKDKKRKEKTNSDNYAEVLEGSKDW